MGFFDDVPGRIEAVLSGHDADDYDRGHESVRSRKSDSLCEALDAERKGFLTREVSSLSRVLSKKSLEREGARLSAAAAAADAGSKRASERVQLEAQPLQRYRCRYIMYSVRVR
jgi:hypothetical protein